MLLYAAFIAREIYLQFSGQRESKAKKRNMIPTLLVTANLGTVFEQESLLPGWIEEFAKAVVAKDAKFVALHMQEIGGKNWKEDMDRVPAFVGSILEHSAFKEFTISRAFLDTNFNTDEFTALGSLYLIHKSVESVELWNFKDGKFSTVEERLVTTDSFFQQKEKFPKQLYPETKWTRKGYLWTAWKLDGQVVDFVNVHLFHDANNINSSKNRPSVYAASRNAALQLVLDRLEARQEIPRFIFGDFNFRLALPDVIQELAKSAKGKNVKVENGTQSSVTFVGEDKEDILSIEPKRFVYTNPSEFITNSAMFLAFDFESTSLGNTLLELPIRFEPSYAYAEDPSQPREFMQKRCPGWCDRILMNETGKKLIAEQDVKYDLVGREVCMGDHKPVALACTL